ncbi:MAG: bifunctional serine/threonine-protein kinase/formylglycine-generating enzyme family protein [Planctomycetota bacterium]|nr:bifunctional serine/threonine-protein kinase/formylglycine-generating enzyme family protein [Planctomycetota bacterium]
MGENGDVRIPGFRIERELGRGAMGVVYLAHEEALGRDVALKVLKPGFGEGDEVRQRFEREVRATGRLKHPGIVPILSTGEAQGRRWFAMQFVPGDTLEQVLEKARHGTIGVARAARIAREVALALDAAHNAGVTHRDVKPGNVMLLTEHAPEAERGNPCRRMRRSWLKRDGGKPIVDRPLLADFGLAADRTASKLSESGMLIGTPGYMAPEQYQGRPEDVGPHSDQWALGVLLYECVTGHMPFPTSDLATLARMIGHDEPIAPSRLDPRVDRDLETICLKALSKNPRDRYADLHDMADDLGHWLREEPISARPPGPVRRVASWARRRPVAATALGALFVVGAILAIVTIGTRIARVARTDKLEQQAQEHMDRGEFGLAEQMYDEWIALDPADGRPRDLRDKVRARRGINEASRKLDEALVAIDALNAGRDRLARLQARARLGAEAMGGSGLGTGTARGSEPWWMRQSAYAAGQAIEQLSVELASRRAAVSNRLAVARSLAEANASAAGREGRLLLVAIKQRAAAWHMGEWRLARAAKDAERATLHRLAVLDLDRQTYAAELEGIRTVRIVPGPDPASAWLFRYEREADVIERGGPRLLPVPYHPVDGLQPIGDVYLEAVTRRLAGEGSSAIRTDVPRAAEPLASTETHVGTLAGALPRKRYAERLAGSAYPLETNPANALGRLQPEHELALPTGRYLLLVRREGHPDMLLPFGVDRTEPEPLRVPEDLDLVRVPEGFVLVPGGTVLLGSGAPPAPRALPRQPVPVRTFLAARFELTYADWWEFLSDPRTRAALEAAVERNGAAGLRYVPRAADVAAEAEPYARALTSRSAEDGSFAPMPSPEQPVAHVSLYDVIGYPPANVGADGKDVYSIEQLAEAVRASHTVGWGYLRWRTERSRERARQAAAGGAVLPDVAVVREADGTLGYRALRFTLPRQPEWERMARGADDRAFVYGDEREWLYFKGVRSRPYDPAPEPVGLFVEDESVFGVRDLTGSVAEWTADWDAEGSVFWIKGHSWGSQGSDDDRIAGRSYLAPDAVSPTVGVRVVVRELEQVDPR